MLRKDLAKKLSNHRRCIVNLVESVKDWQKVNKTKQSFMFEGEDVYKLILKMPLLPIAEHGQDRTLENDFSLAPLGNDDEIKDWLGFEPGTICRRQGNKIDTNPFLLPPFDLKRLAVLTGDPDDMLVAQNLQIESDEEENEDEDVFPYSCAEDMPLVCFICNVGSRDSNGACANCGHVGGDNWQERDSQARQERYEEELEYFEEDKEEKTYEGTEKLHAKKNKVLYDSQIGDEILLKFGKINNFLMDYGARGSSSPEEKEDLGGNVESVHEEKEYEEPSTFVPKQVKEEKSQTLSESDDRIEYGVAAEDMATHHLEENLVEEGHLGDEQDTNDTFVIDETSGKIAITSPRDEKDLGDEGDTMKPLRTKEMKKQICIIPRISKMTTKRNWRKQNR